jgi:hypothetical protein
MSKNCWRKRSFYMLSYFKSNWRAILTGPVFVILVAAGFFFLGRQTAPESVKVVTVDKVTEIRHELQTVQQQINIDQVLKKIQETAKSVDRTVIREVVTRSDGTRVERETNTSHTDQTARTDTASQTKTLQLTDIKTLLDSYKQEEHTKIVEKLVPPNPWRAGVQVGYGADAGIIPGGPSWLLLGGYVERQVLGPISVGAWGNTAKTGGLQLSVSF